MPRSCGICSWFCGSVPPHCSWQHQGWVPVTVSLSGPSLLCCAETVVSPQFFFFFSKGISPYVGIDLVCLWRGGSSGSSSITIWTLSLESICFDCQDDYNLPSYVNVCIRKYSKGWSVLSKCSK